LRPSRASRWLFALIALQFLLGITDLALLTPTTLQVLHLLGADLLWIALVATGAEALAHEPAAATHAAPAQEPLVSN
jgi:cytochrome c oxidase assembly protein subunit 15